MRSDRKPSRLAATLSGVAAMAMAAPLAAQEIMERELNVVGTWSSSSLYPDHEKPFWTEVLPEAADGRITANVQAFDQVGLPGGAVYEMVQQGVYDVGATVMDYVAGEEPRFEGVDLPAIADPALSRKLAEAYRPQLAKGFDETYDSTLLAVVPFTSQVVFCNTPISGLKDLEGKRVRGSGRMTMDFIEAMGGTGMSIAFNEVTIALERGVIDCGVTGALSGYLAGWSEVATHFYPLPVGGWDHVGVAMSNAVWSELDEPTQTFLRKQLAGFEDRVWGDADKSTAQGIACNTGGDCSYGPAKSLKLVEVTDADLDLAKQVMQEKVLPRWAERCAGDCIAAWNDTAGPVLGITAKAD
ncbi:TRAP transporter substrate-binding protein [Geminicoccaceae bacterium 1502E]|nr:TRAP transporter substrate-binding protein [Geminicoccaceae bacterium 1502E]